MNGDYLPLREDMRTWTKDPKDGVVRRFRGFRVIPLEPEEILIVDNRIIRSA